MTDLEDVLEKLLEAVQDPLPTDWIAAISALVTGVVASIALIYAGVQVAQARRAREQAQHLETERAQPYVVAYMEPSAATNLAIDLVIKNYGQTAAQDVRFSVDPTPRRTSGEEVLVPVQIPILAPGQEWRTSWDFTTDRMDSSLPDRHEGRVRFKGIGGAKRESEVVLDWSVYKSRRWVEVYGMHAAARALRDIRDQMKKWTEPPGGPLSVLVRSGDAKDEARRAQKAGWLAQRRAAGGPPTDAAAGPLTTEPSEAEPLSPEHATFLTRMIERGYAWLRGGRPDGRPPVTGDSR